MLAVQFPRPHVWQVYPECQDNPVSYCGDLATPHTQSHHILAHLQKYSQKNWTFPTIRSVVMARRAVFITKLAQDVIFCHNTPSSSAPQDERCWVEHLAQSYNHHRQMASYLRHTRSGECRSYQDPTYNFCKFHYVVLLTVNTELATYLQFLLHYQNCQALIPEFPVPRTQMTNAGDIKMQWK